MRPSEVPYISYLLPDVSSISPTALTHFTPPYASRIVATFPSLHSTDVTPSSSRSFALPSICPSAHLLPPRPSLSRPSRSTCAQPPAQVSVSTQPLYDIEQLLVRGCTIVSGSIYNSNSYRMCGVMNKHNKQCRRIGECPFYTDRTPLSTSNSINSVVDSFGTLTQPSNSAFSYLSTISQLHLPVGQIELARAPVIPPKRKFKTGGAREEHYLFLEALNIYGRGCWKEMAKVAESNSCIQVQSHAQKFFKCMKKCREVKRSIQDLRMESKEMKQVFAKLQTDPSHFAISAMARLCAAWDEKDRSQDMNISPEQHFSTCTAISVHFLPLESVSSSSFTLSSTSRELVTNDNHRQCVAAHSTCEVYEVLIPPPANVRNETVDVGAQCTAPYQHQQSVLQQLLLLTSANAVDQSVCALANSRSPESGITVAARMELEAFGATKEANGDIKQQEERTR